MRGRKTKSILNSELTEKIYNLNIGFKAFYVRPALTASETI